MQKLLLSLFLLIVSSSVFAQHRSEQEAMQIAQEFFGKNATVKSPRLSIVSSTIDINASKRRVNVANMKSCYVINDEANNRFVIVSSDERLRTILGYSDNGLFDPEYMPVALANLMKGYDRELDYINKEGSRSFINKAEENQSTVVIDPMITTKWGQSYPFNAQCPKDPDYGEDTLCVTGCIATAMAQVLNYYKQPTIGKGSYYYIPYQHTTLQYMNFDSLQINWSNLVDNYNGATEEQKAEVAKLMHACGVSVSMNYCYDASGAQDYDIPYAFIHYFGYNPNIVYRDRDYYTNEEWNAMIMEDLRAGRPVLYGGFNEEHQFGHEFIIDGCDENQLYHINFGWASKLTDDYIWSGIGDGYYALNAVGNALIGNFSYYNSMVCNITPDVVGTHEDTFYARAFNLIQLTDNWVYIYILAQCYSSDATSYRYSSKERFSGTIGVGLFDTDLNFIDDMYSEAVSLKSDSVYLKIPTGTLSFDVLNKTSMEAGKEYIIALYVKADYAEKPTLVRSKPVILDSKEYNIDVTNLEAEDVAYNFYKARLVNGRLVIDEYLELIDSGVQEIANEKSGESDIWYTLKGARLAGKPSQSGIYLLKGRKVIVK